MTFIYKKVVWIILTLLPNVYSFAVNGIGSSIGSSQSFSPLSTPCSSTAAQRLHRSSSLSFTCIQSTHTVTSPTRTTTSLYSAKNIKGKEESTLNTTNGDDNEPKDGTSSSTELKHEIQQLILDFSMESNDEIRRDAVSSLLQQRLNLNQNNNGDSDSNNDALVSVEDAALFAHMWDTTLIEMGGEMQNKARDEAAKITEAQAVSSELNTNDETDTDTSSSSSSMPDKPMERQLWAFVDMMIQSKTLIKKAMG